MRWGKHFQSNAFPHFKGSHKIFYSSIGLDLIAKSFAFLVFLLPQTWHLWTSTTSKCLNLTPIFLIATRHLVHFILSWNLTIVPPLFCILDIYKLLSVPFFLMIHNNGYINLTLLLLFDLLVNQISFFTPFVNSVSVIFFCLIKFFKNRCRKCRNVENTL